MTCAVLRVGIGVCVMALTTAVHAATPMTLPFGDFGFQAAPAMNLPVPPAPPIARPDVTQMRLVIKPHRRGCDQDETRRTAGERRQAVIEASTATAPRPPRLG